MTTSTGKTATVLSKRLQFVNGVAVAADDGWYFKLNNQQAMVFCNFAAKVQYLIADVNPADAGDGDYIDIAADGVTYDFDGTGTTVRSLSGPGHFRMLATGTSAEGFAGVDFNDG